MYHLTWQGASTCKRHDSCFCVTPRPRLPIDFTEPSRTSTSANGAIVKRNYSVNPSRNWGPPRLYCSAMRRAIATAKPIGDACHLAPIVKPDLHERRLGPLSGVTREEGWSTYAQSKSRWIEGDLEFSHPGGESFADIARRVTPVITEIIARHRDETVIVVCHGVVIRVLLTSLLEIYQPADFDRIAIDFASVNDLTVREWELDSPRAQSRRGGLECAARGMRSIDNRGQAQLPHVS